VTLRIFEHQIQHENGAGRQAQEDLWRGEA
jgi:hypothetical protein